MQVKPSRTRSGSPTRHGACPRLGACSKRADGVPVREFDAPYDALQGAVTVPGDVALALRKLSAGCAPYSETQRTLPVTDVRMIGPRPASTRHRVLQ